jgi:hypothetical protein
MEGRASFVFQNDVWSSQFEDGTRYATNIGSRRCEAWVVPAQSMMLGFWVRRHVPELEVMCKKLGLIYCIAEDPQTADDIDIDNDNVNGIDIDNDNYDWGHFENVAEQMGY